VPCSRFPAIRGQEESIVSLETTRERADPRSILRELRESARQAARAPETELAGLLARRGELRQALADLPWDDGLATSLREHLGAVESRLERLEGETSGATAAEAEIRELRVDLSWIPLLFPEGALDETVVALGAELGALRPAAEEVAEEDGGRAADALRESREALTRVKLSRLGHRASLLVEAEDTDIDDIWAAFLEARDLEAKEEAGRTVRRALRDQITDRVQALDVPRAAEALARFAAEYDDRVLEALAGQAEMPPEKAAEALDAMHRQVLWVRALVRHTVRRASRADESHQEALDLLRHLGRRLRRANVRLLRESQEVRLQSRLEGIFGARFVVFFENLILWLILAVLVILFVEAVILPDAHPPEDAAPDAHEAAARWRSVFLALAGLDTLICLVFLLEFFTKLALVKGKARWFARHFLVDLVPSIPFGAIAHLDKFDKLRAARGFRFLRLTRVARFSRGARAVIRFVRFFGFLQRATDRLVRSHGSLLNRNVVLFEPTPLKEQESETEELRFRLRQVRSLARRVWRTAIRKLGTDERSRGVAALISGLPREARLLTLPVTTRPPEPERVRALRAEELVERLTRLDPGTVDGEIGLSGARRLATTLSRLDVPVLRSLPGLKPMIRAARGVGEPLERVARAGKALGRYLEGLLSKIHWVSDLSGVVTGPQFLDRLGTTLAQATARPAKRLLLFGFAFLLIKGFVHLLGGSAAEGEDPSLIEAIADWLGRTLGTPFVILGAACLVGLLLGLWFRRVAGEATDFFTRTAEAQFINLLKSAKLASLDEDMRALWDRAFRPESLLRGVDPEVGATRLQGLFEDRRTGDSAWESRLLRLYRDYLDGAMFHLSDTKTTSQLLGNISLENIRTERLGATRRERKRLAALDLERAHSIFRGPYIWFRSIYHSAAQWTAKLILEYNRRAIPLAARSDYSESAVAAMDAWLDRRIREEGAEPEEDDGAPAFVTTEFTALHFLTVDDRRDRAVAERFGEKTLEAVKADRRAMIRTIFGTYPFHRLPRSERTLNPYEVYSGRLAGGRVILFPLVLLLSLLKALGWLVRRVRATLREIVNPAHVERSTRVNWASYDVAVRKINRMRKPLFMECARFRALFDPEYLGLSYLPDAESGVEGRTYREDLERIGARDEEWDAFAALREGRDEALRELAALIEAEGGPDGYLRSLLGREPEGWRESHRAAAVAFAIDYRGARTLMGLRASASATLRRVVEDRGAGPGAGILRRLLWILIPSRRLKHAFREFLLRFGYDDLPPRERRWVWRAVRADRDGLMRLVQMGASLEPGTEPEEAGREILAEVARHPESWSEQLVTLRTVQALSLLDVRNYRRQVWALGDYGNE
jgi:hypothetical protein